MPQYIVTLVLTDGQSFTGLRAELREGSSAEVVGRSFIADRVGIEDEDEICLALRADHPDSNIFIFEPSGICFNMKEIVPEPEE